MLKHGLTNISIKEINRNKVYFSIYNNKNTSKTQIVNDLNMGLSTVTQNLKSLENDNLIIRDGFFESTGGRKANSIIINTTAKISIGIGLLKNTIYIVAIDLYGETICLNSIAHKFSNNDDYFCFVNDSLNNFIDTNKLDTDSILGVSIAVQGILSYEKDRVIYGKIMDNNNMLLSDLSKYISYPCRLEHDSKAAAVYELWNNKSINNAILFLLNRNLGGAIITNNQIQEGVNMHSGIIEHLCIDKNGPVCYCGKKGCLETYCSSDVLTAKTGLQIPDFFKKLKENDSNCIDVWHEFLDNLAFSICILNIVFDSKIILSGFLSPYLTDKDIDYIIKETEKLSAFPIQHNQIILGTKGDYTPAIGAALYYIKDFLSSI
ncbi:MAG: ROK family protein [Clostridium celatum]|nr:ROK family protein [Clostridium celatum]MDU2121320.1 ROK family protein [Clostridium celatum]MDU4979711.1 ROK family protein [Clostridium celatum]